MIKLEMLLYAKSKQEMLQILAITTTKLPYMTKNLEKSCYFLDTKKCKS